MIVSTLTLRSRSERTCRRLTCASTRLLLPSRSIQAHLTANHSLRQRGCYPRVFSRSHVWSSRRSVESDCAGFEQVHGLGSAATVSWPWLLDCDRHCTTNHNLDILAHWCQKHDGTALDPCRHVQATCTTSWKHRGQTAGMWTLGLQPLRVKVYKASGHGLLLCCPEMHPRTLSLRIPE